MMSGVVEAFKSPRVVGLIVAALVFVVTVSLAVAASLVYVVGWLFGFWG